MKTVLKSFVMTAALLFTTTQSFSQTTAMNFTGVDCNGNQVDLFADLDAGKAVVLFYYMSNCGSCPPKARVIQTMANKINESYPGMVKGYAFPYTNATDCAYSSSWVATEVLPLYAPMDSGALQVAYYGGFGMPTVVLLGGNNRDVLFKTKDFSSADTTVMRDLILGMTLGTNELIHDELKAEVFPNPVSDQAVLRFSSPTIAESFVEITDLSGKLILSTPLEMVQGTVEKQLQVAQLKNGSYFVNLHVDDKISKHRITVAH